VLTTLLGLCAVTRLGDVDDAEPSHIRSRVSHREFPHAPRPSTVVLPHGRADIPPAAPGACPTDVPTEGRHAGAVGRADTRRRAPSEEDPMYTCSICHFDGYALDDVAVPHRDGRTCICLGCHGRLTGSALRMPKDLRRQVMALLATLDVPASGGPR
jgi:hypothetical protein